MTHDRLWRDGWLLVAAFSTGFGLLVWPWTGVALYLALATAGGATALLVRQPPPRWRTRLEAAPYPWRGLAGQAGRIGLGTVGFVVVSATMPALVLGLAVLVVLTSPWLAREVRVAARPADDLPSVEPRLPLPRRPSLALPPMPTSVTGMSNDELGMAWRRSCETLTFAKSTAFRLATVSLRAAYLDELERRDPQAFQVWLVAGARANVSPPRSPGEEPRHGKTDASQD